MFAIVSGANTGMGLEITRSLAEAGYDVLMACYDVKKGERAREMLIAQTEENSQLKIRLEQAEAQLRDRRIEIDKAGSLAEAALSLNGVFQAAEAAAQQYLENIQRISSQQDTICRSLKEKAEKETAQIRQEAQAYSEKVHAEADAYWKQVVARAAKLLEDQNSLREMIYSAGKVER